MLSAILKYKIFLTNCQLSVVNPYLILALSLFTIAPANAQLNNRAFEDWYQIDSSDARKLYLGTNIFMFQKDNEYFNQIVDGYTLFGYQFNPKLIY
ncbi:MAG: hypothetical protein ACJ75J_02855, partial [Cytophagaceae bacterium]